jgi:hypothetical protein
MNYYGIRIKERMIRFLLEFETSAFMEMTLNG